MRGPRLSEPSGEPGPAATGPSPGPSRVFRCPLPPPCCQVPSALPRPGCVSRSPQVPRLPALLIADHFLNPPARRRRRLCPLLPRSTVRPALLLAAPSLPQSVCPALTQPPQPAFLFPAPECLCPCPSVFPAPSPLVPLVPSAARSACAPFFWPLHKPRGPEHWEVARLCLRECLWQEQLA